MKSTTKDYKKLFFIGIILIALGVNFSTTLADKVGALGTVFIAIGGLFFIAAMSYKKKQEGEGKNT